jgi:HD-like signal output (HDOD) protein
MQNIQGLCLTVAVRAYLGKSLGQPAMRHIWRHNLACALTTERIAAILGMDKDVGFTSGVMHDIGRLALAALQPAEYSALLVSQQGPAVSILDPEHDLFGFDHCEAGRELIADWRLPSAFESIVSGHHDRPSNLRLTPAAWMMSDVVNLGCRLADTLGFPAFTGCETQTFDDLVAEMPAAALYPLHWNEKDLGAEIAARIGSLEHA